MAVARGDAVMAAVKRLAVDGVCRESAQDIAEAAGMGVAATRRILSGFVEMGDLLVERAAVSNRPTWYRIVEVGPRGGKSDSQAIQSLTRESVSDSQARMSLTRESLSGASVSPGGSTLLVGDSQTDSQSDSQVIHKNEREGAKSLQSRVYAPAHAPVNSLSLTLNPDQKRDRELNAQAREAIRKVIREVAGTLRFESFAVRDFEPLVQEIGLSAVTTGLPLVVEALGGWTDGRDVGPRLREWATTGVLPGGRKGGPVETENPSMVGWKDAKAGRLNRAMLGNLFYTSGWLSASWEMAGFPGKFSDFKATHLAEWEKLAA